MVSTRQMSNVAAVAPASPSSPSSPSPPSTSSSPPSPASSPPPPSLPYRPTTQLLDLPAEVFDKIFRQLKHKTVAHLRTVCRRMNEVCGSYLNSRFQRLVSQTYNEFQAIKSKMPRRESARRSHTLACEFDVIETVHMRLSLLQMTFGKHIERKYCCFFPGEILDEVDSILDYLKATTKLARPFKLTDELFDLSTMAMEFFKEHMEPNLPEITYFGTEFFDLTGNFSPGDGNKSYLCMDSPQPSGSNGNGGDSRDSGGASIGYEEDYFPPSPPPPQSNMVLRKRIHRIKQGMKRYNNQLSALRSDLRSCKRKSTWQQKQIAEFQRLMGEQQKQSLEYASRLDEHDKKNEENSRKIQTLLQELNKCRTELQYWRSKSPVATPPTVCTDCGYQMVSSVPQLTLDQYLSADEMFGDALLRVPSGAEPTRSVSPSAVPSVSGALSLDVAGPVESPLSPKGAGTSNSKVPGSPKARKTAAGGSQSQSSDEGGSKRSGGEDPVSPRERKKRRIHRSSRPGK